MVAGRPATTQGPQSDKVNISRDKSKIYATGEAPFSKRYLKYLGTEVQEAGSERQQQRWRCLNIVDAGLDESSLREEGATMSEGAWRGRSGSADGSLLSAAGSAASRHPLGAEGSVVW